MPPLFPSSTGTGNLTATGAPAAASHHRGLSGGQIAGIVIGSVLGALLLIGLLVLCCLCIRRRRGSQKGSMFNQPSPARRGESGMVFAPQTDQSTQPGHGAQPVGRVARMSALEGTSSDPHSYGNAAAGGVPRSRDRGFGDTSDSDMYGNTPESRGGKAPPTTGKRNGSLSSQSMLGFDDSTSPQSGSGGQYSSPEGVGSGQSEQLPYFKDYYSQDEIHPGDKVATLWAYQPRAGDEFELERGDMLRVVGIWDDGWATGVRISERAENYYGKHKVQRDSGVSNGSGGRGQSPPPTGEIKAFPVSYLPPLSLITTNLNLARLRLPSRALAENHRGRRRRPTSPRPRPLTSHPPPPKSRLMRLRRLHNIVWSGVIRWICFSSASFWPMCLRFIPQLRVFASGTCSSNRSIFASRAVHRLCVGALQG